MNTLFFKCLVINSMILLALGYKTNFNTNGEKQIVDNYIVTAKFTPAQQSSCHSPAIEPLVYHQKQMLFLNI
ncbi:hypothetical protein HZS_2936 [Henneguya salminicola]|nr:hypothetical protein HZS_2936 [Henneguya salminicola]